ncbi:IS66 family transposase [Flavobacterium sp. W21_SRS_FM6]|uniref:IS66 family transposase n=1 Tax=Flavobacterium sp. W21_SRS_FM6 TaxID=3240268 RepID=UPI003F8E10C4
MKNFPETLPTDVTALQEMVVALRAQNDDLIAKNQRLSDMFRLAQQKRFGNSSESYPGQGELFIEAEELVEQTVEDDEEEAKMSPRKKAKREKISADIPRERVVHDIADEDKFCDCCQHALHQIGEDTNEKLEFIPAQATLVGRMAHARRKFTDAQKAMGKHKSGKVDWALNHIQKLYRIETQIKDKTIDERYRIMHEESLPLLAQFKTWLIKSEQQVITKNDLSDAIQYYLNQWEKLVRYTLDGRLSIDNNRAERAIKPFVMGRKAWMFSQTAKGAQSSAVLYSIVESAKANGLTPYDYITHLLAQFSQPEPDIEKLLPWNVNLG